MAVGNIAGTNVVNLLLVLGLSALLLPLALEMRTLRGGGGGGGEERGEGGERGRGGGRAACVAFLAFVIATQT